VPDEYSKIEIGSEAIGFKRGTEDYPVLNFKLTEDVICVDKTVKSKDGN